MAPDASGSIQLTPKSSAEATTMNPPWKRAKTNRPRVSPAMIDRTLVGVENSRRVMPSWRVVITTAAPVMLVRNMNRMTWLSAPTANPLGFDVTSLTDSTATPTPATAD